VATAGNGMGAEVYSAISVATDSLATTMLEPAGDGNFAVHFYLTQIDRGEGCTAPARVALKLIYSDPFSGGAQPFTFVVPLSSSGNAAHSSALVLSPDTISVANMGTGSMVFRAKGATPIQYSTTYTPGAWTAQPRYRLVPVLDVVLKRTHLAWFREDSSGNRPPRGGLAVRVGRFCYSAMYLAPGPRHLPGENRPTVLRLL
jgi:hypothetical protein